MGFLANTPLTLSQVKTTSTVKYCPLGTRGVTEDGRVFYYALNGSTALLIGDLVQSAPVDKLAIASNDPGIDTQDVTSTWRSLRVSATGSTWIAPAVIKDEYQDGFIVVENSTMTGVPGQMVRIAFNTQANDTSTTGAEYYTNLVFAEDDVFKGGADTDVTLQIIRNPYYAVVPYAAVATLVGKPLGVPMVAIPASNYFWLQTWGAAVCRQQDTSLLGQALTPSRISTGTTGTVSKILSTSLADAFTQLPAGIVGFQLGAAPGDGDYGLIFLTICP
jgi:hypothetical protein